MKNCILALLVLISIISCVSVSATSVSVSVEVDSHDHARENFLNKFREVLEQHEQQSEEHNNIDEALATASHSHTTLTHPVVVYLFYGAGTRDLSAGVDALATQIRKVSSKLLVLHPFDYFDSSSAESDIEGRPKGTKFILIGYSMGANVVTVIPNTLSHVTFELVVGYDPSIWGPPLVQELSPNSKRVICYHNNRLLNGVGLAHYTGGAGFNMKNYKQYEITEVHTDVDKDQSLHKITLAAIKDVLTNLKLM